MVASIGYISLGGGYELYHTQPFLGLVKEKICYPLYFSLITHCE